jgi:hypothetical protein
VSGDSLSSSRSRNNPHRAGPPGDRRACLSTLALDRVGDRDWIVDTLLDLDATEGEVEQLP